MDEKGFLVQCGAKIPMRDGINLSGTIYVPKEIQEPVPVILHFTPYTATRFTRRMLYFVEQSEFCEGRKIH